MKKKIILPVLAVVFLLLAALLLKNIFSSPKEKVMLALSKTFGSESFFSLMSGNEKQSEDGLFHHSYEEELAQTMEVLTALTGEDVHARLEFTIEDLEGDSIPEENLMLKKAGLNFDTVFERSTLQSSTDLALTYSGLTLLNAKLYQEEDRFCLAIPDLLDGYVHADPSTFYEDYNSSAIALFTDSNIAPSYHFDYGIENAAAFEFPDGKTHYTFYAFCHSNEGREALKALYEALEVEKAGKETTSMEDKEIKCQNYLLTLPADAWNAFQKDFFDWRLSDTEVYLSQHPEILGYLTFDEEELPEDASKGDKKNYILTKLQEEASVTGRWQSAAPITLTLSMDSKNRILKYVCEGIPAEESDNNPAALTLLVSPDAPYSCSGSLTMKQNGRTHTKQFEISFGGEANVTAEEYHLANYLDDTLSDEYHLSIEHDASSHCLNVHYSENFGQHSYEVTAKGYIKPQPEEKTLKLELTKYNIKESNDGQETLYSYSGKLRLEPVTDETVKKPEGEAYELLHMDFFALLSFMETLEENWKETKLYQLLGDF